MEEIENEITKEELQMVLDALLEREIAQRKREELSEQSFKEWVYNFLYDVFARMGYAIVSFEEFWTDVSLSIKSGWEEGVEIARKEAELKRKKRERKRR